MQDPVTFASAFGGATSSSVLTALARDTERQTLALAPASGERRAPKATEPTLQPVRGVPFMRKYRALR